MDDSCLGIVNGAIWVNCSCQHCAVANFWPHEPKMKRVTLVDRSEDDKVPLLLHEIGEHHADERRLASQESIDTPVGCV